jgi:hypothetical protein
MTMKNDISERMKSVWQNPFATDSDPRYLLKLGANEIDRLQESISEYEDIVNDLTKSIENKNLLINRLEKKLLNCKERLDNEPKF